jgi:hypothetical protein
MPRGFVQKEEEREKSGKNILEVHAPANWLCTITGAILSPFVREFQEFPDNSLMLLLFL